MTDGKQANLADRMLHNTSFDSQLIGDQVGLFSRLYKLTIRQSDVITPLLVFIMDYSPLHL